MIDEAGEQREEELAERDRIGEKAPSADAAFGGRVIEHKDSSHIPPGVAARQLEFYRRLARAREQLPMSDAPRGLFQQPPLPPRHRRQPTMREQVAAAMSYLRTRR